MAENTKPNITIIQIILFLFVFILFVIIGISIEDKNLKISYFLVVSLILFTLFNCYLTIAYYKDLRNVGGQPGERGLKGESGFTGDSGVCTFSEKCGINDCESKVLNESKEYSADKIDLIGEPCYTNSTIENCKTQEHINIANDVKNLNRIRIEKCNNSKLNWEDLKEKLFPPL
uniref:Uncharacterized protein n=1 Tax=viral metagenome TaxID=1070528 RepID=A0A6C0EEY7_9ZZZZ